MLPDWLISTIAVAPPLVFSLAAHEFAHARTALAFGDPTAKNMGRCTLNPLVHLDPIGTLALLFCGFGWAKPVPVNPHNLHPPKWGNIAVSLAGPLSNLMLAFVAAMALRLFLKSDLNLAASTVNVIVSLLSFTMAANICLFMFNLIPLYPLDGHHIARELLSGDNQVRFMQWQLQYGRFGLLALIFAPRLARTFDLNLFDPVGWVFRNALNLMIDYVVIPI